MKNLILPIVYIMGNSQDEIFGYENGSSFPHHSFENLKGESSDPFVAPLTHFIVFHPPQAFPLKLLFILKILFINQADRTDLFGSLSSWLFFALIQSNITTLFCNAGSHFLWTSQINLFMK